MLTGLDHQSAQHLPDPQTRQFVEQSYVEMLSDLKSLLRGILRDDSLIDDALQRTFLAAVNACHHARRATIRGWLFRIAINEARQILRGERRHTGTLYADVDTFVDCVAEDRIGSNLVQLELKEAVLASLQSLPTEYQEVIRRRIFRDMPFADIASEMNLPLGTVLTWMRRGLNKLRENPALRGFLEGRTS